MQYFGLNRIMNLWPMSLLLANYYNILLLCATSSNALLVSFQWISLLIRLHKFCFNLSVLLGDIELSLHDVLSVEYCKHTTLLNYAGYGLVRQQKAHGFGLAKL